VERVDTMPRSDTPLGIAQAMGVALDRFAAAYARCRPDLLLLVGDRFETLAAASAAVPFTIPIAHMHGGELTQGAIDEQFRHAITKLSHLHFVCTSGHAARVVQMGEAPWRVTVSGAASLDNLRVLTPWRRDRLEEAVGIDLDVPPVLVTYHPVTLEYGQAAEQVDELTAGLQWVDRPIVITAPNVDTSNLAVRARLERFAASAERAAFVESLGTDGYWSMMMIAGAMVGNSSSGIIEAASVALPVVNVGNRQAGRDRAPNIIDVADDRVAIAHAIDQALDPAFRARLAGLQNPYGDGHAAERIVAVLRGVPIDRTLLTKRFFHATDVDSPAVENHRVV
jgi:UDP-hydrolysing UDP-N-acetyl-D-glucosamine 2-epimerase